MDVGRPRDLEPARDHHPELSRGKRPRNDRSWTRLHRRAFLGRSAAGIGSLALASLLDPRLLRAGDAGETTAGARQPGAMGGRCPPAAFSGPGSSGSSTCTWPAAPRTWRRSTISRRSPRCTASRCPSRSPAACRSRSFKGQSSCAWPRSIAFQRCGAERSGAERHLPAPGHRRRRHLHHQLDGHRCHQPRPSSYVHEYGDDDFGPAGDGVVADLRAGKRERRSCRASSCSLPTGISARRSRSPRGSGTAGFCPAGSRECGSTPREIRCFTWETRAESTGNASATWSMLSGTLDSIEEAGRQTPRSPLGSPRTRRRSGCRPSVPELIDFRNEPQHILRTLRRRRRRRHVRGQLPAGPPAGRARRAVHPALPSRLGPSRGVKQHSKEPPPRSTKGRRRWSKT